MSIRLKMTAAAAVRDSDCSLAKEGGELGTVPIDLGAATLAISGRHMDDKRAFRIEVVCELRVVIGCAEPIDLRDADGHPLLDYGPWAKQDHPWYRYEFTADMDVTQFRRFAWVVFCLAWLDENRCAPGLREIIRVAKEPGDAGPAGEWLYGKLPAMA